jgi:DNA-binding MarR family transcriptional regulator
MLLPQLEKRGLVERRGDGKDKRVLRLFLTEQGKDITEKAMEIQTALIDMVMGSTVESRCLEIAEHMERIVGILLEEGASNEEMPEAKRRKAAAS